MLLYYFLGLIRPHVHTQAGLGSAWTKKVTLSMTYYIAWRGIPMASKERQNRFVNWQDTSFIKLEDRTTSNKQIPKKAKTFSSCLHRQKAGIPSESILAQIQAHRGPRRISLPGSSEVTGEKKGSKITWKNTARETGSFNDGGKSRAAYLVRVWISYPFLRMRSSYAHARADSSPGRPVTDPFNLIPGTTVAI